MNMTDKLMKLAHGAEELFPDNEKSLRSYRREKSQNWDFAKKFIEDNPSTQLPAYLNQGWPVSDDWFYYELIVGKDRSMVTAYCDKSVPEYYLWVCTDNIVLTSEEVAAWCAI